MRARVFFLLPIAGCAQISGLASLDVDGSIADATVDANIDAPLDVLDASALDGETLDSATVSCLAPSDCKTGNVCCATVTMQGNFPQCQISNLVTSCKASTECATALSLQKCGANVVHLCTSNQDCTEATYAHCCKFPYLDASLSVCNNPIIADAAGATCL